MSLFRAIREGTRRATVLRLLLTPVLITPGAMLSFVFLGAGSPLGLLLMIPVGYLLWTWLVDALCIMTSRRDYRTRRPYPWLGAASVLSFVLFWSWNRWGG